MLVSGIKLRRKRSRERRLSVNGTFAKTILLEVAP
jgi:hypothetical protein